jgi:hypothetical protein
LQSRFFTLAKPTGGSFFTNAVAALSYSGASRLPFMKKTILYRINKITYNDRTMAHRIPQVRHHIL